jgi:Zn ribbon nucleic-acid-binding protein
MGILMISRSILRNDVVIFETECPACNDKHQHQLKVPDQLERVAEKKADWLGFDLITLPDCQDVVKVRPVTVAEEMTLMDRTEVVRAQTCNDTVARIIAGLVSINDSKPDNAAEAITWFKALPPSDSDYLIEEFDKNQPQLSNIVHVQCDECGHNFDHGLRLNDDFFRRVSPASDRGKVADVVRAGVQDKGSGSGPNKST